MLIVLSSMRRPREVIGRVCNQEPDSLLEADKSLALDKGSGAVANKSTMKCRKNNRMIWCNSELLKSVLENHMIWCNSELLKSVLENHMIWCNSELLKSVLENHMIWCNSELLKSVLENHMIWCNSELLKSVLENGCGFQCFQSCFEDFLI